MIIISETDLCLERETMAKCRECGQELQKTCPTDICFECSKAAMKKLFKEHPEVKQAFKESIEDMKKPEIRKRMVDDTVRLFRLAILSGRINR